MYTLTEERALIIECYTRMQEISQIFNRLAGKQANVRIPETMSDGEMLREMRDALVAVESQIGPALESPMIQMLLKRRG